MPRVVLKRASQAAAESVLRQLMPEVDAKLTLFMSEVRALREEMRVMDAKVDRLRTEMLDRFEQLLGTVNEVPHRVTRLDGRIEGNMEAMRLSLNIERSSKRKRAG